ncbi:MAG: glycosyltransferase family 2 protein [Janthinobacterium lividum]
MTSSDIHFDFRGGSVGAVVVFYFADAACVARVNRLVGEGLRVVVVDNTPSARVPEGDEQVDASVRVIANLANLGIAAALNQGIDALLALGCRWALLFDQDSEPSSHLLHELAGQAHRLAQADPSVALVGPAYDDPRLGGVAPFVRFRPWVLERVAASGDQPIDVDFLITSGSCVNLLTWHRIGPMDAALFIDFVDLEWCIRASRKGYRVVGIPWLSMRHELGGEPLKVFGRAYPSHSAARHYYLFRNAIALFLRPGIPWSWKSSEMVKLPVRLVLYGMFFKPRMLHMKMAFKGMLDGARNKLGPLR